MASVANRLKSYRNMKLVRRGNNYRLYAARLGKELLYGSKAPLRRNAAGGCGRRKPQRLRLHYISDMYLSRNTGEVLSCAVACAYDGYVHQAFSASSTALK
jgi:hypothetical protein